MWSFLFPKDRWKWELADGVPSKKVLKVQRQVLRGKDNEAKKQLLRHIVDLAGVSPELQSAFCDGKITADVCSCFLADASMDVQMAAAEALSALCKAHPANCAAAVAAHQGDKQGTLPHALRVVQSYDRHVSLATAAAKLLNNLAVCKPGPVVQLLQQQDNMTGLWSIVRSCSAASLAANVPDARCALLLGLLQQLLELLGTVAGLGGQAVCEHLLKKTPAQGVLLDLAQAHRGQRQLGQGQGQDGEAVQHAAIVGEALELLALLLTLAQMQKRKLPTLDEEGMSRLLRMLRDQSLPWSARLHGVTVLQAVTTSPTIRAEFLKAHGLDNVIAMVEAYVSGRQLPMGSPGGALVTPPRTTTAATTTPPASPVDSLYGTPGGAAPGAAGPDRARPGQEPEPRGVVVVEQLLGLVDVLARSRDGAAAVLQGGRLWVLKAAFNSGLANFRAGGHRTAAAAAQVLYSLSRGLDVAALPAQLAGPDVTGPLAGLVERGEEYRDAADPVQAQVVHGAWCAVGLLTKVMDAEALRGRKVDVASSDHLRLAVRLLDVTAPVLLATVGAVKPPPEMLATAAAGLTWLKRVAGDLKDAAAALLNLLLLLAGDEASRPVLKQLEAVKAVQKMLPWSHVECCAKRFLHQMGELEAEYRPFQRYGSGPLLARLLSSQGLDPAPFQARGVDAHLLLELSDDYLRGPLELDEVAVRKVRRIREAYDLFAAIDAVDGRVDGCVSAADIEKYLTETARLRPQAAVDARESLFTELKVMSDEPICFMQFVIVYPTLDGNLREFMRAARRPRVEDWAPGGSVGALSNGGGGGAGPGAHRAAASSEALPEGPRPRGRGILQYAICWRWDSLFLAGLNFGGGRTLRAWVGRAPVSA